MSDLHPCSWLQFLLEGQEEVGSPDFGPFLTQHRQLLQADYALSADGNQNFRDQGTLAIGLRGAVAVEVELQTLASDQHSGTTESMQVTLYRDYCKKRNRNGHGLHDCMIPVNHGTRLLLQD